MDLHINLSISGLGYDQRITLKIIGRILILPLTLNSLSFPFIIKTNSLERGGECRLVEKVRKRKFRGLAKINTKVNLFEKIHPKSFNISL